MTSIFQQLRKKPHLEEGFESGLEDNTELREHIREAARKDPEEAKSFCRSIRPTGEFSVLDVVYDALAEEENEVWGDFLAEEYERILKLARKSERPAEVFRNVDMISLLQNPLAPWTERIIRCLSDHLGEEHPALRKRIYFELGSWLRPENKTRNRLAFERFRGGLQDPDWKIRYLTWFTLKKDFGETGPETQIPFTDHLRNRLSFIFGSPFL